MRRNCDLIIVDAVVVRLYDWTVEQVCEAPLRLPPIGSWLAYELGLKNGIRRRLCV
jgi:hypothetical protein